MERHLRRAIHLGVVAIHREALAAIRLRPIPLGEVVIHPPAILIHREALAVLEARIVQADLHGHGEDQVALGLENRTILAGHLRRDHLILLENPIILVANHPIGLYFPVNLRRLPPNMNHRVGC